MLRARMAILAGLLAWGSGSGWPQDVVDRELERRVERLKQDLKLTNDQALKVKAIYKEDREAQDKMEKEQRERIREVLTDEQRKAFDEPTRRRGGGLSAGRAGEENLENLRPVLDDFRKTLEELRDKGLGGLGGPEQAEKLRKVLQEGASTTRDRGLPPNVDERVKRVLESLKIADPAEAAAIESVVRKVAEAQRALQDFDRELRAKVDEMAGDKRLVDEEIEAKLAGLRETRREKDKGVRDAQRSLNEVVSLRQELELIRQGILR